MTSQIEIPSPLPERRPLDQIGVAHERIKETLELLSAYGFSVESSVKLVLKFPDTIVEHVVTRLADSLGDDLAVRLLSEHGEGVIRMCESDPERFEKYARFLTGSAKVLKGYIESGNATIQDISSVELLGRLVRRMKETASAGD
jgi:hypothetical protein